MKYYAALEDGKYKGVYTENDLPYLEKFSEYQYVEVNADEAFSLLRGVRVSELLGDMRNRLRLRAEVTMVPIPIPPKP